MQPLALTFSAFQRLKTPADFQRVYRSKQWGHSQHFSFNVCPADVERGVLGVTVSKKVSKRAVDRNRIKRQIREFYRRHQHELVGAELVLTAKPSCLSASDADRVSSLTELWEKLLKWQQWHTKQMASASQKSH